MKRLALALAALMLLSPAGSAQTPGNHVVIISLDGFPAKALADPYLPLPTLRRLAARGAIAKAMIPVNPTVTWANHTSMVTGVTPAKHHVIFNGLLVHRPGMPPVVEPWRDKAEMVHARTLYDAAHEARMTTAQVDWVAIWNAPTITWEFRERPMVTDTIPREMVQAGLISEADVTAFGSKNIVWRDEMWTTAAAFIMRQHRPNLMLFHLLNLDSTHHRYGPGTPAGMTTMAHLDAQVARIVDAVEQAGIAPRTTFFIVSDHGFKTVRRHIRPNAAFAKAGLIKMGRSGNATTGPLQITSAEAYSYPEAGTALVYVTVPDANGAVLARTKQALAGIEGIERVVEPAEFGQYGLPQPAESNQMSPLFLVAKDGYAFVAAADGDVVVDVSPTSLGSHGYVASDPDLHAIFIASGRGIRPGVTMETVSTLDIAPSAARLLGLDLGPVQGKVLNEILIPN
jgi:predicted AlkP superfamily pyrophosphatase or phosphodiesterase